MHAGTKLTQKETQVRLHSNLYVVDSSLVSPGQPGAVALAPLYYL
jgi:hypothetical protein